MHIEIPARFTCPVKDCQTKGFKNLAEKKHHIKVAHPKKVTVNA